ncbi:3-phosphoshikimate 1-carboxyvinyltransferase [Candidatus Magnetominusculus dajiuhuensis]|uniref:3-phosphoshikimate 1-carboxyvinyltransferase n=1 Tax=Candidatus Magnetominusculus dajiuhuensis TaxID=3137712 RepID=UPI003B435E3E
MFFEKTAIIGVGLIGATVALAMKRHGITRRICGFGRNEANLKNALSMGIIDEYALNLNDLSEGADLVVFAAPVRAFMAIAGGISPYLKAGAIVTDVGSVKGALVYEMEAAMPEGVAFVGAHPIAGNDKSGIDAANPDIFMGAKCIITPTINTDKTACQTITAMWKLFGCKVEELTPEMHDEILSSISHLPHIAAYALVNAVQEINPEYFGYSGPGFMDTTRIAMSSAEIWRDICILNKENILKHLNAYKQQIEQMIEDIENSNEASLTEEFKKSGDVRRKLKTNIVTLNNTKALRGEMMPPPDKSVSHRAVFFSSLANGRSRVGNILRAADTHSTIAAFAALGIGIDKEADGSLLISGRGLHGLKEAQGMIDCGNSGTTARLLCGLLAGSKFFSVLTGDKSLSSRPMGRVIVPLEKMGASIKASGVKSNLPMAISGGHLRGITYEMPIASAQVKSAVLLAGLLAGGETTVVEPVKSRDHTERMLKAYGVDVGINGLRVTVKGGTELYPRDMVVPGDISSAAFFIAGALMVEGSGLLIKDVGLNPTRTGFIDIIKKMGADVKALDEREVSGEPVGSLLCKYTDKLLPITLTKEDIPSMIDEFPILCVLATRATGVTEIRGAHELRVKESDRISAIVTELRKMGAKIEEYEDGVAIEGPVNLKGSNQLQSYGDHRIAMALSIAAIAAEGESVVHGSDAVNISYPEFYDTLKRLTR